MGAMGFDVSPARADELPGLAAVAAATFPLACPPSATPDDIRAFIDENLSAPRFAEYLADSARDVLLARRDGAILGYAMLIHGVPDDPDVQRAVTRRPAVEVNKMYVAPDSHGAGASTALMSAAIDRARHLGAASVWLGVNQKNERAQRFYAKHGFTVAGTKTFQLGRSTEHDYVMVRPA